MNDSLGTVIPRQVLSWSDRLRHPPPSTAAQMRGPSWPPWPQQEPSGSGVGSSVDSCWYRQQCERHPMLWEMVGRDSQHNPQGFVSGFVFFQNKKDINMGCPPGKSCLLGIQRNLTATLPATAPVGTAGRPRCAGLLSRRRGAGAGPPPLAAPRGRQTVPRASPGASRCAVGWELHEQRARSEAGSCSERGPALPVETNIYKQGLSLLLAGLELSILIFQMGNSN